MWKSILRKEEKKLKITEDLVKGMIGLEYGGLVLAGDSKRPGDIIAGASCGLWGLVKKGEGHPGICHCFGKSI
ncbi:hypothetical protein [Allofournierella sp.]|uniref:hypothetical protein n=1 Tax=Allofournierella sp. TaxID=1940256 RepID=UPI003AB84839